ncbi:11819_t:CDS:2 [Entrophospora sp. SA101]|nr:11819_t:CDS:2 [Entrophospora sp. SA101]
MEPSSQKDVSNNIRITLPPPTTLQNNNNSTLSRLDDSLNNFPIISSILGHNNLNNFIFPQRHYSATNSNNLIDSLTSNRISSPVSIPSLSSLTQFLDERRRNTDLESHNNNTNNIKDIDNNSFYHYDNKNDCHQNDDNNKIAEGDEVMEEIITNDKNEIINKSIGNNHNKKIKKMKNKHKKIVKKEHHHHLGQLVYSPKEILPPLEFNVNSLLEVWISAKHLSWENLKVRKRFLWGTDIYTDDSDIVAGNYIPIQYNFKSIPDYPDYDLCVTIRVCPKLSQYPKSTRNNYKSRAWGNHDGVSYKIEKVEKMRGKKLIKESSRKSGKKTNDLVVFNKHGDPCNYLKNKLRVEVMYLENDDETYEISYDEIRDKYRFAIVSSDADCPLKPKDLYEIFRDDLEFHEISWNILGLVVADKTNYLHSLLCIIQRVFWRPKLA